MGMIQQFVHHATTIVCRHGNSSKIHQRHNALTAKLSLALHVYRRNYAKQKLPRIKTVSALRHDTIHVLLYVLTCCCYLRLFTDVGIGLRGELCVTLLCLRLVRHGVGMPIYHVSKKLFFLVQRTSLCLTVGVLHLVIWWQLHAMVREAIVTFGLIFLR